ncbi:MAG: DUF309 domain-containing protein [Planctomycetaceae bacterium]|nr:DUF309 domain-containing protein [Planctomycetaceae bacterium]
MENYAQDPRIDEGMTLFNRQEFFACHDVFEDLWSELSGREKTFVQGLIHAAVSLYHFEGGNLTGARKMYGTFRAYTHSFRPHFWGIDVASLQDDMEVCFRELLTITRGYPHGLKLNPDQIPRIQRV